ncbi:MULTISPECIES: HAMP domain-containing methyl-accepting chemotaxis protein [unclassified Rhizobium]|uniref:HAMP domain-containing methyl-accepting chemotaxis protein n=1 Tax=unclassified Rhizobium TaxID=2613769 RepID=UPI00177E7876|nr:MULTISPECIES: methyl-accepting chemotaxis protein [unclassified Rhizobium]MBD8688809.1 methyl-accepting chemotaxis protein [Rhizobium sp. CFBP 13644]MBD8694381.1 methyl-accepting chemotaxis protein [Rhizobium sp. CFBP 13717]
MLNSIGARTAAAFGSILAVVAATGILNIYVVQELSSIPKTIFDTSLVSVSSAKQISANMIGINRSMKDVLLASDAQGVDTARAVVDALDADAVKNLEMLYLSMPENRDAIDMLRGSIESWRPIRTDVIELVRSGKMGAAVEVVRQQGSAKVKEITSAANTIVEKASDQATRTTELANEKGQTSLWIVSLSIAGVVALCAALAYIAMNSIVSPLKNIANVMNKLSNGELNVEIPGLEQRGEIGSMATAVDVFRQNALKIRDLAASEAVLMMKNADLQSNIATVVDAAVAGDFTRRITKRYDDPDLDRFASNVNSLVQSVDAGIANTSRVISALARGDLTESMEGLYQGVFASLQLNVNETMFTLRTLMQEVRQSADAINGGADEIRQASDELSRRTETQAASLEETSAALEEITVAVKTSTERAQESNNMVTEARQFAEASADIVSQATSAMSRIEQASSEITQIINVIDEIAFQTNLLALNAGVEAARAGEAGKGFAVVAQEVRELAQRSATAAKDIKTLITKSSQGVLSGVQLVNSTGQALSDIQMKVIGIAGQVSSIAIAAREQSVGLTEVNVAVTHMDQMTQQNAAMVEEAAASTAKLAEETAHLKVLISRFKISSDVSIMRRVA